MKRIVVLVFFAVALIASAGCSKNGNAPKGFVLVKGRSADLRQAGDSGIKDFYMAETEVTQALYKSVMGENPSMLKGDDQRPVEQVSWYDAVEFCNKLSERDGLEKCYSGNRDSISCDFTRNGYRLPTEAEWEYAAKGGNKSKGFDYSGSDDINEVAWYSKNSDGVTHPVKSKKPNELGLYDMSGNVWEWCWDSASGSNRIDRGGCWHNGAYICSVSSRHDDNPSGADYDLGFRLARSVQD